MTPTPFGGKRRGSAPYDSHDEGRVGMRARWPSLTPISYLPQSRPASGGLSRKLLLRFRLRASDFLSRQKVTKDRLKDPWSLRISFPSNPAPCLPLNSALREPTRPGPARCRPWAIEGPPAPDGKAPCVGSRRSVDRHPPTPSAPAPRRPSDQRRRIFVRRVRP